MRYSSNPFSRAVEAFESNKLVACPVALLALLGALSLCWQIGVHHESSDAVQYRGIPETIQTLETDFPYLAVTELDQQTQPGNAAEIDLNTYRDTCAITAGGEYILSGELNGTVHILAKEQSVHLYLNNAEITSKKGPALYCEEADKLIITLLPDTANTISDSGKYNPEEEVEACIYSDCDLIINGTGALNVNAYYKDAVRSRDIVKLLDGQYSIKCKRTAVHGNDGIVITGGNYTVSTEKYGFKTTKSGLDGRGNLVLGGGTFSIIAGRNAFVTAKADMYAYDCSISNRSIVSTFDVAGMRRIEEGCLR